MSNLSFFFECNVLIGVIWHETTHKCFSFNVMDAIDNVYVRIFPFLGILISYEVYHTSFNFMSFDLDWNNAIVSGWYLRVDLTIPIVVFCSQFLV